MMKKLLALLLCLALGICLAACGPAPEAPADEPPADAPADAPADEPPAEETPTIVFITNDSINDGGWNQSCYAAMSAVAEEYGFATSYTEYVAEADYVSTFSTYAGMGMDLIFAPGNEYTDAVLETAALYPDTGFILLNGTVSSDNVVSIKADNVQRGFLVGVLASLMSESKAIGYIAALEITTSLDAISGLEQGLEYMDSGATLYTAFTGSWSDSAKGKELAVSMISTQNVDVFFGDAGTVDVGVREACAEYGVYDVAQPDESLAQSPDVILTSMITDTPNLIKYAVDSWVNGEFGNYVHLGGAADGVIYMGQYGDMVSEEVKAQFNEIYDQLAAGEIELKYE